MEDSDNVLSQSEKEKEVLEYQLAKTLQGLKKYASESEIKELIEKYNKREE